MRKRLVIAMAGEVPATADDMAFLAQANQMEYRLADVNAETCTVMGESSVLAFILPHLTWKTTDHPITSRRAYGASGLGHVIPAQRSAPDN